MGGESQMRAFWLLGKVQGLKYTIRDQVFR